MIEADLIEETKDVYVFSMRNGVENVGTFECRTTTNHTVELMASARKEAIAATSVIVKRGEELRRDMEAELEKRSG